MRILCLQHVPFEGPAAITDWALTRGHTLDCHPVYQGGSLPELESFDALLIMGGPMNIYEEAHYPWLSAEKALIRSAIAGDKYVIGICLGAQLIAEALGAKVTAGQQTEIGWYPIQRSAECPSWLPLPDSLQVLHWHGDTFAIPSGAVRIAESAACPHQGFTYGRKVLAWQCHLESTPESLAALVDACADELREGAYIMPQAELLSQSAEGYQQMQQVLFQALDALLQSFEIIDWGATTYEDAFTAQKERVAQRRQGQCGDALIFTEHTAVYTMGMRKDAAQHLVWTEAICAQRGIAIVQSNRGGDITYHGPGQIVGYPILSLDHRRDLHAYLRDLEEVVIRTLATYGLESDRREGKTGIWLGERKICAIGVAVRTWVTYHGFALNVAPDMSHFDGIVPCGITDGTVTSMAQELGAPVDIEAVKRRLAVEFQKVFRNTAQNHG